MGCFIEGEDRSQSTLLSKRIDDYVADDTGTVGYNVQMEAVTTVEKGLTLHCYWNSPCKTCPLKT